MEPKSKLGVKKYLIFRLIHHISFIVLRLGRNISAHLKAIC